MLRNATIRPGEPPRPSRCQPRKDWTPARSRTATTTTGREAAQDDSMQGSSDDHLRRPTTDEPDVIEQDMVIDAEFLGLSDDRSEREVVRMDDDVMDQQTRRRMTGTQLERRSSPDDETSMTVSKRQKREATIAASKQGRDLQDRSREARFAASALFVREHWNRTECRVDSGVAHGGNPLVERARCR